MNEYKNLKELLYRLNVNSKYDIDLLRSAFSEILNVKNDNIRNTMLGSFLTAIMTKNPTSDEVVALLKEAFSLDNYNPIERKKIQIDNHEIVTLAGSGKKGVKTINISTASALLASSMGAYVVKPGSKSTSSVTGSADFMEIVGANKDITLDESIDILNDCGFAFFCIEDIIPKFDKIYGGNFFAPHVLSFGLAALICPVKTDSLLYGLAHPNVELSLDVLKKFGNQNVLVVSSTDDGIHFIDEMGVYGETKIIGTKDGINNGNLLIFNPIKELGLPKYTSRDIAQGKTKEENIKYILSVLAGNGLEAHEDIVCINCANILYLSRMVTNYKEGYVKAKEAIKTGQGLDMLIKYIKHTGGNTNKIYKLLGEKHAKDFL